jgi:hypothetical protein
MSIDSARNSGMRQRRISFRESRQFTFFRLAAVTPGHSASGGRLSGIEVGNGGSGDV